MRILFAIKALDNAQGGAERVLADVASGLAERGHEVFVLSFDPPKGRSFYPLNKKVKRIALGIGNVKHKATVREVVLRVIAMRKTVLRLQPDCVVAFMHSTFIPASLAMIRTGVPLIASEHIVPDHYRSRRKEYCLLFLCSFFVKKITALSHSIISSYPPIFHSKMHAIENPVSEVTIKSDPKGQGVVRKVILNVGRLTAQKDQRTLIEAFALIAEDYPDWDLKIIGEGELRGQLEGRVSDLNLGQRVFLPGTTSEIEKEYQHAHVFALPSQYESFGLATAEAMAHGLPAIGFASCPGTNELISNGKNGVLVKGDDRVKAFSDALRMLMSDELLRATLGNEGIKTIKQFHPEAIIEKWEQLILTTVSTPEVRG